MEPNFVIAGGLQRDYLLPLVGRPLLDVPGGSLINAAAGLGVWGAPRPARDSGWNTRREMKSEGRDLQVGLLARVGEDYPQAWLHSFEKFGWDTRGIHILPEELDLRYFQSTHGNGERGTGRALVHFNRLGLPFPKSLLGYKESKSEAGGKAKSEERGAASPCLKDIPPDFLNARAVHICPLDYLSASRLSATFRQASVITLTLDPSSAYMHSLQRPWGENFRHSRRGERPRYSTWGEQPVRGKHPKISEGLEDVRSLLQGLTAFLPSEEEIRALFWGRTDDLWQMAEALGECGCEFIVVKCGARGQMLYDSVSKKRWEIPAYPARVTDLLGAGDSFCGGFLAGYQKSYDPLRGVLCGCVSASLTIEGSGVFHALEGLPGLAEARLEIAERDGKANLEGRGSVISNQ